MATVNDVKLDKPVEIYPSKTVGVTSTPLEVKPFILMPEQTVRFINELHSLNALSLIEETLQGLAQRTDGTLLKTAFPTLAEFQNTIEKMSSLPKELLTKLSEWSDMGATEINLDFEEKSLSKIAYK